MAKFDLHKTQGIHNVMNAVQQVKTVNDILPLTEAKELRIESIYPSGENFYAVSELDELSESIREWGILQPLLVSERDNGTYEIIAGNRRYEAAKMAGLPRLPCIVKQNVEPNLFKIMLIHANMFRVKSDMERATEVAELKKAIVALKASDKSIKGRTGEIAGQILNLSARQINRLDNLNKLIPEIQSLVRDESITASCAEQFAGLEESTQKEIYKALIHSGMDINRNEATRLKEEFQARSRELETQKETEISTLREQIQEEQAKLQEKEQELADLMNRVQAQEHQTQTQMEGQAPIQPESQAQTQTDPQGQAPADPRSVSKEKTEIERVKQALVSALQDRRDIEERYNRLSQQLADRTGTQSSNGTAAGASVFPVGTERLINEVKRRVQLQECIGQLKLASRLYGEYHALCRSIAPVMRSSQETALLEELLQSIKELSGLVTAE